MKKIIIALSLLCVACNNDSEEVAKYVEPITEEPIVIPDCGCVKTYYYQVATMGNDFYRTITYEYFKIKEESSCWNTTNGRILYDNGAVLPKYPEYVGPKYATTNYGFYSVICTK